MQTGQRRRVATAQLKSQTPAPRRIVRRHAFHIQRADLGQLADQPHRSLAGGVAVDHRGDGGQRHELLFIQRHDFAGPIDRIAGGRQQMEPHRRAEPQRKASIQLNRPTVFRAARQQAHALFALAVALDQQKITARRATADPQTLAAPRQPVGHRPARHRQIGIGIVEPSQGLSAPVRQQPQQPIRQRRAVKNAAV